jgi:hypothetical protein
MGYVRQRKVYRLRFADEDMAGLVVQARSAPVGQFLGLAKLAELKGGDFRAEDAERIDELFRGFASCLVDWNLEGEDGTPVPATLEGIYTQETDFILQIIFAWIEAIAGVSVPLGPRSSDGGKSLEGSMPMATLSPNHQSSRTLS